MSGQSSVDVVIAVHQQERPVERAVSSVLSDAPAGTRVVLVCHNLPTDAVRRRLPDEVMDRVDLVSLVDGVASAAGPFNTGLARSQATYVSIMGSDDFLRPGAIAEWVAIADAAEAPAVMARIEHQKGGLVRTPPTRLGRRTTHLDFARDRLAYRTAPLGLVRRSVLRGLDLHLEPGLATGEDLAFGLQLWTVPGVVYAKAAPAYVVGSDAVQRVTMTPRPVSADLECCTRLVDSAWFEALPAAQRLAVVVKLLRVHVFGAIANRHVLDAWEPSERAALATFAGRILAGAPSAKGRLSLAEDRLLAAALEPRSPDSLLRDRSARRLRHGQWDTVVTRSPHLVLAAQSPARLMAASALMR